MPRIATATSPVAGPDEEASTTRVDDLVRRGRSQGHLSLAELRTAFDKAGLSPAEGRSILRELSESGVRLANELAEPTKTPAGAARRPARVASAAAKAAKDEDADADLDSIDADVVSIEAEAAALGDADRLAEADLDDQTPAM